MAGKEATNIDHSHSDEIDVFGFWLYILTDCILFGTLFATYIVLSYQGFHTISLRSNINLYNVMAETYLLLASSFTYCLAILSMDKNKLNTARWWLIATFLLGASFIFIEVREFIYLSSEGFRWDMNGQASAFFTLVGTHGLHVSFGLLWMLIIASQLPFLTSVSIIKRRLTYLGLFWGFLDIVWIFVFTIVYLMGAM